MIKPDLWLIQIELERKKWLLWYNTEPFKLHQDWDWDRDQLPSHFFTFAGPHEGTLYSNLNVSHPKTWFHCYCECENFSIVLFLVPFQLCLNKPLHSNSCVKFEGMNASSCMCFASLIHIQKYYLRLWTKLNFSHLSVCSVYLTNT